MRIAALDVGSNSFHLMVVEVHGAGPDVRLEPLERAKEMVRLGESTLVEGAIPPVKLEEAVAALDRLRAVAQRHAPDVFIAVATSAVREARNGAELVALARARTGVDVRVIDGEEEARLIFLGARETLDLGSRRVALLDVGGGSTEVVLGTASGPELATSLRLGVLRLRDEWRCGDPPTAAELEEASALVRAVAGPTLELVRSRGFDFVALTSGTAQALMRLALLHGFDLTAQDRQMVLSSSSLRFLERKLAGLSRARRARLPGIEERRTDTILTGAIILRTSLDLLGAERAVVSGAALREGLVRDYLAGPARRLAR